MPDKKRLAQLQEQYKKLKSSPKFNLNSEELYCTCRKPDNGDLMIVCDGCDEWFHFKCMNLDVRWEKLVDHYYCPFCDELFNKGKATWKRKCRLPGCYQPAAIDASTGKASKYCSEEHGVEFMSRLLARASPQVNEVVSRSTDYSEFKQLGSVLPKYTGEDSEMSESARTRIDQIDKELAELQEQEKRYSQKEKYVAKYREKVKYLSGVLGGADEPGVESAVPSAKSKGRKKKSRSKSKKSAKLDLCGFDSRLRLEGPEWTAYTQSDEYAKVMAFEGTDAGVVREQYEELKDENAMIEQDNTVFSGMCVREKKKCLKHQGWYAIVSYTLDSTMVELAEKMAKLKQEKEETTRLDTVHKWEAWERRPVGAAK